METPPGEKRYADQTNLKNDNTEIQEAAKFKETSIEEIFKELRLDTTPEAIKQSRGIWEMQGTAPEGCFPQRFGSAADCFMFSMLKLIALADSLWVPFMLTFGRVTWLRTVAQDVWWVPAAEMAMCGIYAAGILWRFITTAVDMSLGLELLDLSDIAAYRFQQATVWLDLLSLLGNFWWYFDFRFVAFRLLRMWRLPQSAGRAYEVSSGATESLSAQVVEIFGGVWLMAHFFACTWFAAVAWYFVDIEDMRKGNPGYIPDSLVQMYLQCLRDGAAMLVGWNGPGPSSPDMAFSLPELVYWIITGPSAAMYMAYIFARLLVVIDRLDKAMTQHMDRMDKIGSVLASLTVPAALSKKVMQYHAFLSVHNIDKSAYEVLFQGLSSILHVELKLFLFERLVLSAPFFRDVPPPLVMQMVTAFEEQVFSPGDVIVTKGEMGSELFFIIKGSVEVLIDDDCCQVVAEKGIGEYFGEIALVYENQVRTAWVRARSFCLLAKLTKAVFESTLQSAPHVKQKMMDQIAVVQGQSSPTAKGIADDGLLSGSTNAGSAGIKETTPLLSRQEELSGSTAVPGSTRGYGLPASARPNHKANSEAAKWTKDMKDLKEQVSNLKRVQTMTQGQLNNIHSTLRQIQVGLGLAMP